MEWLSSWTYWHWLILGFILLIGELIIPGVFLLWWGAAALIMGAVVAFLPNISLITLWIIYAVTAALLSLLWWRYQQKNDRQDHSTLNLRDQAMLGTRGYVETIDDSGIGRGHFGDTTWRIQGDNLRQGDAVEVIAVQGITLIVRRK